VVLEFYEELLILLLLKRVLNSVGLLKNGALGLMLILFLEKKQF
jgi:hypothetical protein